MPAIELAAIAGTEQLNATVPVSVNRIQELLTTLGYEPGDINGEYGPQTKTAIQAFQKRRGFPVDGLLSERLLDQLGRAYGQLRVRIERCLNPNLPDAGDC